MKAIFHYNWPIGENSVVISFGMATVPDQDCLFRMGIIIATSKETKVFKHNGDREWLSVEELEEIKMLVKHGDLLFVDRKNKKSDEIEGRCKWDTGKDWPADAQGGTSVDVPFNF